MPVFTPNALTRYARSVLVALGSSEEDADIVAEHLVSCNLAGHDSHGVIRLLQYARHVDEGKIDPSATPRIERESSTTAVIDGNKAWGQVVAMHATRLAIEKAREHACAAVAVRNCYHIGRVGVYPLHAAREGFLAQVFCNGYGVARVAPWGGTEAKLATNPIAMAVPRRDEPVLVDITTSVVAEGKVRVAKMAGKTIPEGWILDKSGQPSTDPGALYENGTILPFGGAQGHKGYGLSVMVDLFGGVLTNAGAGFMTESVGNGLFIQISDPTAFTERSAFLDRVEAYIAYLRDSSRQDGIDEILVPGEPELRTEAQRRKSGIEIDAGTAEKLDELSDERGARDA